MKKDLKKLREEEKKIKITEKRDEKKGRADKGGEGRSDRRKGEKDEETKENSARKKEERRGVKKEIRKEEEARKERRKGEAEG